MSSDPSTLSAEHARAVRRVMHALQFIGAAVMLVVWALESRAGAIAPWDRWLLPLTATLIAGAAVLTMRRPDWEPRVRVVPVLAFNVYLVMTLLATVAYATGPHQWYQTMTAMYWVPLGYGCAFVFLPLRLALAVSGFTAAGIFGPMTLWSFGGRLPDWFSDSGPLLPVLALAHGTFVVLLAAVVTLRSSHARAHEHMAAMHALARTDVLTGLPNRRAMLEELTRALATAQRDGQPVAVALIDIDHFKRVNDSHGHAAGDAVLREAGELMRSQLRAGDRLARWGGEEFLLCAPGTTVTTAGELTERLRLAVQGWSFPHAQQVTISVGLTQCLGGDALDTVLKRADRALYLAKARGRNRVETQAIGAA